MLTATLRLPVLRLFPLTLSAWRFRLRLGTVEAWRRRAQRRGQLARLSDREFADIGLGRLDAVNEFSRPFWRD